LNVLFVDLLVMYLAYIRRELKCVKPQFLYNLVLLMSVIMWLGPMTWAMEFIC